MKESESVEPLIRSIKKESDTTDSLLRSIRRKSQTFKKKRLNANIQRITGKKLHRKHSYQTSSINKNLKEIISRILENNKLLRLLALVEKSCNGPYITTRTVPPQTPESASVDYRH